MSNVTEKIKALDKGGRIRLSVYASVIVATLVLFLTLIIWAGVGVSSEELEFVSSPVLLSPSVRTEFLVGEEVGNDGVALQIGKKIVTDCEVSLDTSTAGDKYARVSKQIDSTVYSGTYPVTVFAVRHLDVRSYPDSFDKDENGEYSLEGLVVWAEVGGKPKQLQKTEEHPDWESVIVLSPDNYTTRVSSGLGESVAVTIDCGKCSATFVCADLGDRKLVLDSADRVLPFTNKNGGDESLVLYVTKPETNGSNGTDGAEGIYVFTDASGNKTYLKFAYYLNGWESRFVSAQFGEGVTEKICADGNDYEMSYSGVTFVAAANPWRKAIVPIAAS